MLDTVTYLPKLKEFEGVSSFMYLDTTSNVTVGVGNLLATVADAQNLAFVRRADALPADDDEIENDFDNVSAQPPGRQVGFYKQFTACDLPGPVIDSLLNTRVREFATRLRVTFPPYDTYPDPACAAIFDMAFNLGLGKLTSGFPNFCRAVRNKDWATAAAECKRGGIGDSRNNWTRAQFEAA